MWRLVDLEDRASVGSADLVQGPNRRSARPLEPQDVRLVRADPGVYAAWIDDEAGLRDAGIDAGLDRPVYVGQAGSRGLQARIRSHVRQGWGYGVELTELRAARGGQLFMWGGRRDPKLSVATSTMGLDEP
jgi:hypothetical protein